MVVKFFLQVCVCGSVHRYKRPSSGFSTPRLLSAKPSECWDKYCIMNQTIFLHSGFALVPFHHVIANESLHSEGEGEAPGISSSKWKVCVSINLPTTPPPATHSGDVTRACPHVVE